MLEIAGGQGPAGCEVRWGTTKGRQGCTPQSQPGGREDAYKTQRQLRAQAWRWCWERAAASQWGLCRHSARSAPSSEPCGQATQAQRWRCGPGRGGGLGLCTCGVEIWKAPRGASFLFWARCEQRGVWGDSRRPCPVSKWGPQQPDGCSASRGDTGQRGQGHVPVQAPQRPRAHAFARRRSPGGLGRLRAAGEGARGRAVRGTRCCERARGLRRC